MPSDRPLETLALLQRLRDSGVEFVIVGGVAAITHGSAVTTEDLDVCAPLTQENAQCGIPSKITSIIPDYLARELEQACSGQ